MKFHPSRRTALKWISAIAVTGVSWCGAETLAPDRWQKTHDRIWLSGDVWANPMEDWRIREGGAECLNAGLGRSVHSLTHQLTRNAPFRMEVTVTRVADHANDPGAGFRIGLRSELNEYRSNCFEIEGVRAGWMPGQLVLGSRSMALKGAGQQLRLILEGRPDGQQCLLKLSAEDAASAKRLGSIEHAVPAKQVFGNVSLAHNLMPATARNIRSRRQDRPDGARYRFERWTMGGDGFRVSPEQRFGPILWTMYSLSDSRSKDGFVMKLSALTGPMGGKDSKEIELLVQKDGRWHSLGTAALDTDAWVATFRIANWDASKSVPFKVVYHEQRRDGSVKPDEWSGTIRANPAGKPLRMAGLTCQNDYGFPYAPVADNLIKLDPDLLFFSGDQIYEAHGGFGIIRRPAAPAIISYLRKYYQFGWAFREAMRNAPTLCLPDDHDVFQGNLWGEGGKPMASGDSGASSLGGYIEPVRMVNAVHKTTVAHHPDPYDPTPAKQGMSVYFGDMVYGGVGFAIIADRQWKSGPEAVDTGEGRPDHVVDPDFDTSTLDKPGLALLGGRQEAFLKTWASDWRGHSLKAVLSQTVFAAVATHHGGYDDFLKADLDSGSWPQAGRNRAVELMRPSMALHINGDQHLASLVKYGVAEQRDGNWSFCTPAIAAGYPRWWRPDDSSMPHSNRPSHGLPNTGDYIDGFGNKVHVQAVGNPVVGTAMNRYQLAHEKGSGFGMITFDTANKTYHLECFRFLIDATDGKPTNQFPGWPVTIEQKENGGVVPPR